MRHIELYDTTLRDGSQAEGISFSLHDKLRIARRLDELGFDFIEGGYPASNEKDAGFFREMALEPANRATLCAFGMTRRKGLKPEEDDGLRALLDSRTPVVTIVGKSSSFQAVEIIRSTREENLAMIAETLEFFRVQGRRILFDAEHFFDGYKNDPDYSLTALKTAAAAGAERLVLCDTNGGTLPEEVAEIVRELTKRLDVPLGIHCHNDCGLAVACSIAAVDAGAVHVQGTINGFGERCGNADLIQIAAILALKKHGNYEVLNPGAIAQLTELSRYVFETANFTIPFNSPFVGKSAFAHKGGMHVSGIARHKSAYEHIDPEAVGNERRILVSELSGRSNIVAVTRQINQPADLVLTQKILDAVVEHENAGYQFEAAEGSFELLVRKCAGTFTPHFERLNFHVIVESIPERPVETEATVKIRVGDLVRHEVAEGDGPVDALDAALRKALLPSYPELDELKLTDYKVRVINSEAAAAAMVRVIIESADNEGSWGTVGVSTNVVEASWIALADSIEYKLHKQSPPPTG